MKRALLLSFGLAAFLLITFFTSKSMVAQQAPQSTAQTSEQAQTTPAEGAAEGNRGRGNAGARPAPPPPPPAVMPPPVTPIVSMAPPVPDPRIGLAAGRWDAAQAAWNMRVVSITPPSEASAGATH